MERKELSPQIMNDYFVPAEKESLCRFLELDIQMTTKTIKKIYIAGCGGMLGNDFYKEFSDQYKLK